MEQAADYRKIHRKAGEAFEKSKKVTPRESLAEAGQEFEFIEKCSSCHLNYEGSGWKGAKKPYTPFTPTVDKKYRSTLRRWCVTTRRCTNTSN